jgi:sugar/nucleoside kinase (ribokinase family)
VEDKRHGQIDYLIIGHVVQDILSDGSLTFGGTATYAGRTAYALGCRVGVVTSTAPDLDLGAVLGGCDVIRVPAERTTTFKNVYTGSGRQQYLYDRAAPLDLDAVPERWRRPDIVHLAPLTGEMGPTLASAFPDALRGATPQGWMRTWDGQGKVRSGDWCRAMKVLPHVNAAILSLEDVDGDEDVIARFAELAPLLVVTLGAAGCRVYTGGKMVHVPVARISEVDPTGAGDIFAAAFLVRLRQSGDPVTAARFANRVAALSVSRIGWSGTPTKEEIDYLMRKE